MPSTGEVPGLAASFEPVFSKAKKAAHQVLPAEGAVLTTVHDSDKRAARAEKETP